MNVEILGAGRGGGRGQEGRGGERRGEGKGRGGERRGGEGRGEEGREGRIGVLKGTTHSC